MNRKKVLNLDKICRVCICERKDMRPLFSEKIPDMLTECTNVTIDQNDGWPDKICVQCVHAISRNHSFKTLVEKCNTELHEYIKNLSANENKKVGESHSNGTNQVLSLEDNIKAEQQLNAGQQTLATLSDSSTRQKIKLDQKSSQDKNQQVTLNEFHTQQSMSQVEDVQIQRQNLQAFTSLVAPVSQNSPSPQHLLPNTQASGSLSQILTLPNGQIFTTPLLAQSLAMPTGAMSTHPNVSAAQNQMYPQLLQSSNGHTFQLIPQANGTQALQIVQLVSQRGLNSASLIENTMPEEAMHLLVEGDIEEELNEGYEQVCSKGSTIETIVLEDESNENDSLQDHEQEMLRDTVEFIDEDTDGLEYFDEISEATSQRIHADNLPDHFLQDDCCDDDDPSFIIEDNMDTGITEEEDECNIHASGSINNECEFIQEQTQYIDADSVEGLNYTVMDATDCGSVMENELANGNNVQVFHVTSETNENIPQNICENVETLKNTNEVKQEPPTVLPTKRGRRGNNSNNAAERGKLSSATSRQLAVTAQIVANNANTNDDGFEVDTKLLEKFIEQQTTVLPSGRFLCKMCSTQFKQAKGLQNHMYAHANWIRVNCRKQPQCNICQKSFKGPGMLRMHMKTHQAETSTPTCSYCHKTFKSKAILYRHRHTHQLRRYACAVPNCCKTLTNAANLRGHAERKHPNVQPPQFSCGRCNQPFDNINDLQSHVTTPDQCLSCANDGEIVLHSQNTENCPLTQDDITIPTSNNGETTVLYSSGQVYILT